MQDNTHLRSEILRLVQQWSWEVWELKMLAATECFEVERDRILAAIDAVRGCETELQLVLLNSLDLAVEADQKAFESIRKPRGDVWLAPANNTPC